MFGFMSNTDINAGYEEWRKNEGALLVDVREPDEYWEGHLPDSINVPLGIAVVKIADYAKSTDQPIFVYCLSDGRSGQACERLKKAGYSGAKKIGGIMDYKGKVDR